MSHTNASASCGDCERPMVPQRKWALLTTEQRAGKARHGRGKLCDACAKADRKAGRNAEQDAAGPFAQIQPLPAVRAPLEGERRRAALAVCHFATDSGEAAEFLDMLDLLDVDPAPVRAAAASGRFN